MRWLSRLMVMVVMVGSTSLWAAGGDLPGSGTEGDPYLIEDLADFDRFAGDPNYWDDYTRLETDIDLDDGRPPYTTAVIAPDTRDANPRAFNGTSFSGLFDGDGHVIRNLTIDTAGAGNDFLALFGYNPWYGVGVKNLGMENINITGGAGSYRLGGLSAGNSGPITNCYATGSVTGGNGSPYLGGLCGSNDGIITNCYATGSVTGGDDSRELGGLCGYNSGTITNCYATGSVTGGDDSNELGGLCGWNSGTITNCYATGSVTGGERSYILGGLCGYNMIGTITNCYSGGSVTGGVLSSSLGGLCGYNEATITTCFWDIETSGIGEAGDDNFGATGKTTLQMQTESTFRNAGWDFDPLDGDAADWMMLREAEDYPRLVWQEIFAGDIAGLYGVDWVDFAEFALHWGRSGCPAGCEDADIDGDGSVNAPDLMYLSDDWIAGAGLH